MSAANLFHSLSTEELIQQMPGFFGILDEKSKFVLVNQTGAKWTGFNSSDQMIDLSYGDVRCKAAEDAALFLKHDQIVKQKGRLRFLGYYCYSNNDWKVILGEKYILKNKDGQLIGLVSHFNDFTHANSIDINRFLMNDMMDSQKKIKKQFFYAIEESYPDHDLTKRQSECLFFLMRGKTAKQISFILGLSIRTIETYIEQLKVKMNCESKSDLLEKSIHLGYMNIIPLDFLDKLK